MLPHVVLPTTLQSENYCSRVSDVETEAQEPMGLMEQERGRGFKPGTAWLPAPLPPPRLRLGSPSLPEGLEGGCRWEQLFTTTSFKRPSFMKSPVSFSS